MPIKLVMNDAAFDEIRTSPGAKALLKGHADDIEQAANAIASTTEPAAVEPYYETYDASDKHRARYRVATTNIRAARHEAKTFALERARSSSG